MILPGYDADDNAFYGRAIVNYPDRTDPHADYELVTASNVTIAVLDRDDANVPWPPPGIDWDYITRYAVYGSEAAAYTDAEVSSVIRKGKEQPRRLSLEESRRATENRRTFAEDASAMEVWYLTEGPGHSVQGLPSPPYEMIRFPNDPEFGASDDDADEAWEDWVAKMERRLGYELPNA